MTLSDVVCSENSPSSDLEKWELFQQPVDRGLYFAQTFDLTHFAVAIGCEVSIFT